jgi:predicted ABC-type ATPase
LNVDRPPDDGGADPERATETPQLTEPAPEAPPPPEPSPPKEDPPATEKSQSTENTVQADDSPETPDTAAPPPDPAEARETAEPRSRQEHADQPPPPDEDAGAVDTGAKDRNEETAAEAASDLPRRPDVTPEGDDDEIGMTSENPMSDSVPNSEDGRVREEDAEERSGRQDPPSNNAEDSGPADETPPAPNDDAPADDDRILPLTDKEWAEHVTEVRDTLDKARAAGLTTDRLYTIDPDRKEWNAERNRLQGSLITDLYERAQEVPCDRQAIIAGGLGGAGKTTVLREQADIDLSKYLTINPDDIKEEMARRGMIPEIDNLSPMEASDLAHEESSYIAKRLALRAMADGKNIIWDITMSSRESTEERVSNLREAAYSQIDGMFVDIPPALSITRTEIRHRKGHEQWRSDQGLGGRFVPPEVIEHQADPEWGSRNRRTYEAMKDKLDNWSIYDNSVHESPATLIDSSEQKTEIGIGRGRHEH